MALGNQIIVTAEPKGVFLEGIVQGALQPGIVVQIDVSEAAEGGRFTYEPYNKSADGDRALILVLLEDSAQGKIMTAAYVDGDRCRIYIPANGEELNMLLQDVAGTADDHAIGEQLIVDDSTGTLIATTGSPESEPFDCLEVVTDPTTNTLARCQYTGH